MLYPLPVSLIRSHNWKTLIEINQHYPKITRNRNIFKINRDPARGRMPDSSRSVSIRIEQANIETHVSFPHALQLIENPRSIKVKDQTVINS